MGYGIIGRNILWSDNAAHAEFPQFAVYPDFLLAHHHEVSVWQNLRNGSCQTQCDRLVADDLACRTAVATAGCIETVGTRYSADNFSLDPKQIRDSKFLISRSVCCRAIIEGSIVSNVYDDGDQVSNLGSPLILEEGAASATPQT